MMHSMFPIIPLATDPGDLRPVESLALTTPLVVAIVACLLLAVGLIALIIMLSRPARKPRNSDRARGAHSNASSKAEWRARIDDVVARHESGALPRHEAFVELSVIARDFAGAASGKELSSQYADRFGVPESHARESPRIGRIEADHWRVVSTGICR